MRQKLLPCFEKAEVERIEALAVEKAEQRIAKTAEKKLVYWVAQIHQVLFDTLEEVTKTVAKVEHALNRMDDAYRRDQDDADWWKRGPQEDEE